MCRRSLSMESYSPGSRLLRICGRGSRRRSGSISERKSRRPRRGLKGPQAPWPGLMIRFTTKILQFGEMGEKTGWSYIRVPAAVAEMLLPGNKKSFRVKGRLDDHAIEKMALLPMGEGDFIMALKASIRKTLRKQKGDSLRV